MDKYWQDRIDQLSGVAKEVFECLEHHNDISPDFRSESLTIKNLRLAEKVQNEIDKKLRRIANLEELAHKLALEGPIPYVSRED